jgi:hypothetical protein
MGDPEARGLGTDLLDGPDAEENTGRQVKCKRLGDVHSV